MADGTSDTMNDIDSHQEDFTAKAPETTEYIEPQSGMTHLIAVPILVVLLDYLVFQGAGGLSFAILFITLPIAIALAGIHKLKSRILWAYLPLFVLVAGRCTWQYNGLLVFIATAALLAFAIAIPLGKLTWPDLVATYAATCVLSGPHWAQTLYCRWEQRAEQKPGRISKLPASIALIPGAICAAFALVFFFSNPILQSVTGDWYNAIDSRLVTLFEDVTLNPRRLLFWAGCLIFTATLLRPVVRKLRESHPWLVDTVTPKQDTPDPALQYRVALNTLIAVNILFVAYNAIDAWHLVIRDALPPGLNHSQYAHQGAFWLTVALFMTTLTTGWLFHGNLNFHEKRATIMRWAALWLAQNFLLALWVFMRVHMYISYNGLTRMRVIAIAGTTLVLVGLLLVTIKALRQRSLPWLLRKELGAFLITSLCLTLLPVDSLVWHYNTHNILQSDPPRTAVQLTRQPISPEGLATLIPLLDHPDATIAQGAAALLGRWRTNQGRPYVNDTVILPRWTHYQLSHAQCARILKQHEKKIFDLIPDRQWEPRLDALRARTDSWI